MSRSTPFVLEIQHQLNQIDKAFTLYVQQLDLKQYTQAGCELGRIEALSDTLHSISRMARDALWEDNQNNK
jgi:hypothetical protein